MEWGIHEDYTEAFFYHLLPNAPSSEKAFLKEWQPGTIERFVPAQAERPWMKGDTGFLEMPKHRIIVESKSYSREDWVQMSTYATHVKALHSASLTRLVAIYLRLTHDVSYLTFYQDLIEGFFTTIAPACELRREIENCYSTFINVADTMDRMVISELPSFSFALDPANWLYVNICLRFEEFFGALKRYLCQRYPEAVRLASVIEYQKNVVILPDYDRRVGKRFETEDDWLVYFNRARGRTGGESLPEPESIPGTIVIVNDQACGEAGYLRQDLAWEETSGEERWLEWIERTALHRNSAAKKNFQEVRIELPTSGEAEKRHLPATVQ